MTAPATRCRRARPASRSSPLSDRREPGRWTRPAPLRQQWSALRHARLTAPTTYRKSFPLVPLVLASTLAIVGGYLLSANMGRGAPRRASDSDTVSASGPSTGPDPAASASAPTTEPRAMDADSAPAQPARPARASELPRRRPDARSQTATAPSNSLHTSISNAPGRPSAGRQSAPQSTRAPSSMRRRRRPRHQPQSTQPW